MCGKRQLKVEWLSQMACESLMTDSVRECLSGHIRVELIRFDLTGWVGALGLNNPYISSPPVPVASPSRMGHSDYSLFFAAAESAESVGTSSSLTGDLSARTAAEASVSGVALALALTAAAG